MQANSVSFDTIFSTTKKYFIPYFQRPYVWTTEQIEDFAASMWSVSNDTEANSGYFMGTIIAKQLRRGPNDTLSPMSLIDGQQRVTTFYIFFKVLSLVYNDEELFKELFYYCSRSGGKKEYIPVFETSANGKNLFSKIVELDHDVELNKDGDPVLQDKKLSKKERREMPRMISAYNTLRSIVKEKSVNGEEFKIDNIKTGLKFINMLLDEYDDEQVYFDNINSLGVRLTTGELVKNFIFSSDDSGMQKYEENWAPIFEGENIEYWSPSNNSKNGKSNIDIFLFYYMEIKAFSDPRLNAEDKCLLSKKDGVANHIKQYISKVGLSNEEVLKEIIDYAKIFKKIMVENIGELDSLNKKDSLDEMLLRLGYLISKLRATPLIPYVMYIVHESDNTQNAIEMIRYIESYLIRRSLYSDSNKNYNRFFRDILIGNNILTLEELKDKMRKSEDDDSETTCSMPTDDELLENYLKSEFEGDNETPKALLYLLELELQGDHMQNAPFCPDKYTLEHLMPQSLKLWGDNVVGQYRYCIGNMCLITQKTNSTVKNRPWVDKLNGFEDGKSKFEGYKECCRGQKLMNDVITKEQWTDESIDSRTKNIVNEIIKVWKY